MLNFLQESKNYNKESLCSECVDNSQVIDDNE